MKRVIILGAGFAGLHIFYKIHHLIGKKIELVVVDQRKESVLKPSLPEVALVGKPLEHSLVDIKNSIENRGAIFINKEVVEIFANSNKIVFSDNEDLEYDYLFVALGAVKDYDAIKGYHEYGYSVCDDREALKLWNRLGEFKKGKVVTGAAKSFWGDRVNSPKLSAPCEGPIGEVMFMIDYYLKEVKKLQRGRDFKIDIFTPSEIFFEDVGSKSHELIGDLMNKKDMTLHNNKILKEIGEDFISFEDGSSLECNLAIVIPPYKAPKVILNSNIGDEKGFIPTNEKMIHLDYPNIFSAGDITSLAQPKLGHIAIIQGAIAVASMMVEIGEDVEIPPYEPEVFCIMNMGGHYATLISSNYLYGGDKDIALYSPMAKMMKWGFDSYLYYNKGHMPPDVALEFTDRFIDLFDKK